MQKKDWKALLLKGVFLTFLIVATFQIIRYFHLHRMNDTVIMAAIIDKHANLNKLPAPRLILIGGSNCLFGFNSDTLQKHRPENVMNMALLAPLGLNFLLNDLETDLKKGDTVIMTPEYDIEVDGDTEYLLSASDIYEPAKNYVVMNVAWQDRWKAILVHYIKMFQETVSLLSGNLLNDNLIYYRKAISPKGDIMSHINKPGKSFPTKLTLLDSVNYSKQIKVMNDFIARSRKKGVKVYYVYPNLAQTTFDTAKKPLKSIQRQLEEHLDCKIIGKPEDFVFADSLFFDTFYHLKPKGRDMRTHKLIELLNNN